MIFYGKCFRLMPDPWLFKVGKERWTLQLKISRAYLMDLLVWICAVSLQHFQMKFFYADDEFFYFIFNIKSKMKLQKSWTKCESYFQIFTTGWMVCLWKGIRPFENVAHCSRMLDQPEQSYNDPCRLLLCSLHKREQTHPDAAESFYPSCRACSVYQWYWVWKVFSIYFLNLNRESRSSY